MAKLTTKEVAGRLGITPTRVQQLILDGKLSAEKFGRDWMIEEEALANVQVYGRPGRPPKSASPVTNGRAAKSAKKARAKKSKRGQ